MKNWTEKHVWSTIGVVCMYVCMWNWCWAATKYNSVIYSVHNSM